MDAERSAPETLENSPQRPSVEFIALVALTTSLVAMAIDTMLPALGVMASELGAASPNDRQLVLSAFFGGMMVGQVLCGPASDSLGRRRALFIGIALFVVGNLMCALAPSFGVLLAGRALSGFGAASPRIVSVAMVRDAYGGRGMARVMSFVSTVFILVPVLAPSIGQGVLVVASWRAIYWGLVVMAIVNSIWLALRQPETLPESRRVPFSVRNVLSGAAQTFRHPLTLGYMMGTGVVFGAFINYLSTAQQIFQEQYGVGKLFPVYFGLLASGIGVASFVNGRLVMRFGMRQLSRIALVGASSLSLVALFGAALWHGHPPLPALMAYLIPCFFFNGILFGNFNARAMEPMGRIAGVAAAVIGSVGTLVALAIGTPFGRAYDGTVLPLIGGYLTSGVLGLLLTTWAERKNEALGASAQ
ncbi:MAG: MFS transporter [Myxococcales bacterium]|nr:MAG: MFS transporter [Myxococcales bacterium]